MTRPVRRQARILALVRRLRGERQLAYLLITRNLAIIPGLCEQMVVPASRNPPRVTPQQPVSSVKRVTIATLHRGR